MLCWQKSFDHVCSCIFFFFKGPGPPRIQPAKVGRQRKICIRAGSGGFRLGKEEAALLSHNYGRVGVVSKTWRVYYYSSPSSSSTYYHYSYYDDHHH